MKELPALLPYKVPRNFLLVHADCSHEGVIEALPLARHQLLHRIVEMVL